MRGTVIYRKQKKLFMVMFDLPRTEGKRNRLCEYFKSEAEANAWLVKVNYEYNNGVDIAGGNVLFSAYLQEWNKIYNKKKAETTKELYQMYIDKHIIPALGRLPIKDILPKHIQEFYNVQSEECSDNTILKYHSLLNRAFRNAVANRLIVSNPCDGVVLPRPKKYKPVLCRDSDVAAMLDSVYGTIDEVCILLAASAGLCRGEILGLRWRDILQNKISIKRTRVRFTHNLEKNPKNEGRVRTIIVLPSVMDAIRRQYKPGTPKDSFIVPYTPQSYSKHFKALLEKHGIPHMRLHDLRHYNATIMMRSGIPDKVAAERLGHTQLTTTRGYQHSDEAMDQIAVDVISEAFPWKGKQN